MTNPLSQAFLRTHDHTQVHDFWTLYHTFLSTCLQSKPVNTGPFVSASQAWREGRQSGRILILGVPLEINASLIAEHAFRVEGLLTNSMGRGFLGICAAVEEHERSKRAIATFAEKVIGGDPIYLARVSRATDKSLEALTLFAVYVCRPIRQAIAQACGVWHGESDWPYGYCPVCGLWPRMAHIDAVDGKRRLWCLGCGTQWQFPRLTCPFCGENDQKRLGYLFHDQAAPFRVYTCEQCHRYLKTNISDKSASSEVTSFDEQYLTTASLDILAGAENYIQDFVGFIAFDAQDNVAARTYRQTLCDTRYSYTGE